jgi:hypothetical protein
LQTSIMNTTASSDHISLSATHVKLVGSAGFEPAVTSAPAACPEARMLTKLHHNPSEMKEIP